MGRVEGEVLKYFADKKKSTNTLRTKIRRIEFRAEKSPCFGNNAPISNLKMGRVINLKERLSYQGIIPKSIK